MARTLSLTARLATLFALFTASLLVLAAVGFGRMLDTHFRELDLHELHGKVTLIRNALQAAGSDAVPLEVLTRVFAGQDNVGVLVRRGDGQVLGAIHPEHFTGEHLAGRPEAQAEEGWTVDGRPHRGVAIVMAPPELPAQGRPLDLLVALDLSHHGQFLASVRHATWAGVALAALGAALFGWVAAHRGLAPLRRVTETARGLSAQQLGERLRADDAPREVRDHVEAFNGMLSRLETAFQRLADYSADIAHELRTPISNLMTQTQVALSRPRSAEAYQDILASNLEEYERIARMVGDMLFLAKAEENALAHAGEAVDLGREADDLIEFYEALAEERHVCIRREGEARVRGDRLMLRRALSNLVSNALRHAAEGSEIVIRIIARPGQVMLEVHNLGDPIPADQIERIFDRFHRGSAQREHRGEGAGLGLAITRSIVRAHGGDIAARSGEDGTCFAITLPRGEPPSRP